MQHTHINIFKKSTLDHHATNAPMLGQNIILDTSTQKQWEKERQRKEEEGVKKGKAQRVTNHAKCLDKP